MLGALLSHSDALHCCEQVSDLAAGSKQTPLGVRHDKHQGFFVEGLSEQPCATCQDALVFMHRGLTTRHIRSIKLPLFFVVHDLVPHVVNISSPCIFVLYMQMTVYEWEVWIHDPSSDLNALQHCAADV